MGILVRPRYVHPMSFAFRYFRFLLHLVLRWTVGMCIVSSVLVVCLFLN